MCIKYYYEPLSIKDKLNIIDRNKKTISSYFKEWGEGLMDKDVTFAVCSKGAYQAIFRSFKGTYRINVAYKEKK